ARRAKAAGLALVSFTDHDSMEGAEEKRAAAEEYGLLSVSGWEVSAYSEAGKVHVLGYGCKPCKAYEEFLKARKAGGFIRAEDSLKKANSCFSLALTMADIEREHTVKETPLHTMHVVRAFAKALGMDAGKVYLGYFAKGKAAYSGLCRPTPEEAIDVVHGCGGIAVLAHPGRICGAGSGREALMEELVARGLDGIECTYTTHTAEETEYFRAYAAKRGLLETGGSDFHEEGRGRTIGLPAFVPSERLLGALGLRF
ncbi:MAG: PHP domain-containing protein, partial [Clostridia bacterium]|nr:PHP domain-containing protein [Clostridia bacterium]